MRIWDLHCHLPSFRVPGETLSEQIDGMLTIAGRVGIEKIGLFLRTPPEREAEIEEALERHRGRAFGFVWVDLEETQRSLDLLDRWVGEGPMVGLKLGGGSGLYSKPAYDPVFQKAVDLGAVVYMHTWIKLGGDPPYPGGGNFPKESTPHDVVAVAERYPDYPFICGHTGGDWQLGIQIVRDYPNVSIGIGGGYPQQGQVAMGMRELGVDRIIYGSDVTGRSFSSQLSKVYGAPLTDAERQRIFFDNLHHLMQPILSRKGIEI